MNQNTATENRDIDDEFFDLVVQPLNGGLATHAQRVTALRKLVERGAEVRSGRPGEYERFTPLGLAARNNAYPWVAAFHEVGLPLDFPTSSSNHCGPTPALSAIEHDAREFLSELRKHGLDVRRWRSSNGGTLLHYAVAFDRLELVEDLLDWGARINARTDGDEPVISLARGEVLHLLARRGADINTRFRGANLLYHSVGSESRSDVPQTCIDLVRLGADLDERTTASQDFPSARAFIEALGNVHLLEAVRLRDEQDAGRKWRSAARWFGRMKRLAGELERRYLHEDGHLWFPRKA